ncbi:MAG: hypothetical protein P8I97_07655 [Verrucomicrobiales bacterium]|nr:hypothetical protein [Verrucomicrobiales bacterium]
MHINNIHEQISFTTKDGSTIISILDKSNVPVKNQSLAEARLPAKKYHPAMPF